jgi:hypothetical protein
MNSEYQGILREDLVNALTVSINCKMEIWRDLKDKLVTNPGPEHSRSQILQDRIIQKLNEIIPRTPFDKNWSVHDENPDIGHPCRSTFLSATPTVIHSDGDIFHASVGFQMSCVCDSSRHPGGCRRNSCNGYVSASGLIKVLKTGNAGTLKVVNIESNTTGCSCIDDGGTHYVTDPLISLDGKAISMAGI